MKTECSECDTDIRRVCHVSRMRYLRKGAWKWSRLEDSVDSGHTVDLLRYDSVERDA